MADFARSTHLGVQAQLDRLSNLSPAGDRLGLERIAALLDRLDRPQDRLAPVFHVAGTNGKGSTVAFLRAALEASGHKVHVFTSPHLVRFNERIRIAGNLIEDDALAEILAEVIDAGDGIEPSFFEVAAAAAILAFARTPADACILEVGLGGRLDATNVIERPLVTGISDLALDHQHFLGRRLTDIAGEKAGIAKRGVPLITQDYSPLIARRIEEVARERGAQWLPRGDAWRARELGGKLQYQDRRSGIDLPLPCLDGAHQARNAALAIAMLRHQQTLNVPIGAMSQGLESPNWPARLQLLGQGPITAKLPGHRLWLDGGHNRGAALAIAAQMAAHAPFDLIFALMRTRRIGDVLGPFAPLVRKAYAIPLPGHPHHDPHAIAALAQERVGPRNCYAASTLNEAIERLAEDPEGRPDILIFGSLYLAGEVLAANEEVPA